MPIPALPSMWSVYPTGSSTAVKKKIGGNVDAGYIANTCVIRVSYCFNACREPIPGSFGGLLTVRGGDGKRYALRVKEFKEFLQSKYRPADIHGKDRSSVEGKTGLIMFDVTGWSDATGHFDLWDGSACRGSDYFDKASDVYLWEC